MREVEALREALVVAGDHNGEHGGGNCRHGDAALHGYGRRTCVFKKSDARRRSLIVNPAIRELLVEAEEVLKSLRPEAVSAVATADAPARRRADSDDEAEGVAKQVKTFGRKISALVNGFGAGANVEPGDDPFASNEVLKVMAAARKRSALPASINLDEDDEEDDSSCPHGRRPRSSSPRRSKFPSKKTPVVDVVAEAPWPMRRVRRRSGGRGGGRGGGGGGAQEPPLLAQPSGRRARVDRRGRRARSAPPPKVVRRGASRSSPGKAMSTTITAAESAEAAVAAFSAYGARLFRPSTRSVPPCPPTCWRCSQS